MDPHSTHQPHNYRTVKKGPQAQRYAEIIPKSSRGKLDEFSKKPKSQPVLPFPSPMKPGDVQKKEMFTVFVNDALTRHCRGDSEPFHQLVLEFSPTHVPLNGSQQPEPPAQRQSRLRLWLTALSNVVSRLERVHSSLIQAIAELPWATMESPTVKAYTVFIGMLLSAHPEYLALVLGRIAQGFTLQPYLNLNLSASEGETSSPITSGTIYDRYHYLLKYILSLIPTLSTTLLPFLAQNFPHKRQKELDHSVYIRNLLRVGSYCPEIADKLLGIIVDRAVRIDVEIQVEIEDLEESEADDAQHDELFDLDLFEPADVDAESSSDSDDDDGNLSDISSDDDAPGTDLPLNIRHVKDMVKKLDTILLLILEHSERIHQQAFSPQRPPEEAENSTLPPLPPIASATVSFAFDDIPEPPTPSNFSESAPSVEPVPSSELQPQEGILPYHRTLVSLFDRLLLPTFKSRYTQFLIFHSASLSSAFSDLFLGLLLERSLFLDNVPAITRAAAASYIASFVSRARFVNRDTTRTVVGLLCEYISKSLGALENQAGSIGGQDTPTFYAVIQAVFLIFCFRWRDLLDDDLDMDGDVMIGEVKSRRWMKDLRVMHRAVNSSLNPLRVCSPNVTQQFARVAQATDFVYCYTILEANNRLPNSLSDEQEQPPSSNAPQLNLGHELISVTAELNTFFPFDPYKLPRSSKYIDSGYREWGEVAIVTEGDAEDSDSDEEDGPEEHTGIAVAGKMQGRSSVDAAIDGGLEVSLGAMSISPDGSRVLHDLPN